MVLLPAATDPPRKRKRRSKQHEGARFWCGSGDVDTARPAQAATGFKVTSGERVAIRQSAVQVPPDEESLTLRRQLKHKFGIALSLHRMGKLEFHHRNYASAQTGFEESLILHQKLGMNGGIAQLLHAFGSLAAAIGQTQTATTLWGASTARHKAIGSPVPLHERESFRQETTCAAGMLGQDAFSTAWNLGLAMTEEQAIRYTLERAKEFAACDPV